MAGAACLQTASLFCSAHTSNRAEISGFNFKSEEKRARIVCSSKKKISFADRILDYIEGGPKLRKWYGAPELLPRDGPTEEEKEDYPEGDARDAVLVTDGDNEIGQMIILSLIVNRTKVKTLVKDKRVALEAFGTYVEFMVGDATDEQFLKKALRGVCAVICPNEGLISNVNSWKGLKHVILLSQLSVYEGMGGFEAVIKGKEKKMAKQDELTLMASGVPYTIIRAGRLENTPAGNQGFSFEEGIATRGSLSKEDAAIICVKALEVVPEAGFIFEVVNGKEKIPDWKECLTRLMEKAEQEPRGE